MRKKVEGNYTLEAAILLPLILFIITALLYTALLLHDWKSAVGAVHLITMEGEAVARKSMDTAAGSIDYEKYLSRGIFEGTRDYSLEETELEDVIKKYIEDKVFITYIEDIKVELTSKGIRVNIKLEFQVPMLGIGRFFKKSGTDYMYEDYKSFDNQPEFIRIFRVMMDTGENLPGADTILSSLKKVFNLVID
ncbi:MAG: putative rane protein [Anaerocolumna sp.]|jgi:hypothetical protein|nr:putative rane protein [Anaerocolumna sp.]